MIESLILKLLIAIAVLEAVAVFCGISGLILLRREKQNPRKISGRLLIDLCCILFGIAGSLGIFLVLAH